MPTERNLIKLCKNAHSFMRSIDGLQPQEAFDELLKYLFFKQIYEEHYGNSNRLPVEEVKYYFKKFLKSSKIFSDILWPDYRIHLSDSCLEKVHALFYDFNFKQMDFDVRGGALAEFISSDIRKGLGIFLTPGPVVQMMVNYVKPSEKLKILDPACGSGAFLIETLKYLKISKNSKSKTPFCIFGFDKNPKMLLLSKLNLTYIKGAKLTSRLMDFIKHSEKTTFDLIITNPPFGVSLDSRSYNFNLYKTCQDEYGYNLKSQTSEIVFIEKCLKNLAPGGTLAIIIPKSIITNNNLQRARNALSDYGYIEALINLPPETFALSGTQTATSVLFIKKYRNEKEPLEFSSVAVGNISNTGYDSTGRERKGEQLSSLPTLMKDCLKTGKSKENVFIKKNIKKEETFKTISGFFTTIDITCNSGLQLSSLCHEICIGKTPARNAYSNEGGFILKVGNLTGVGINWEARDRNYVSEKEMRKRKNSRKILFLKKYDILLTASAHNIAYIAKKSDMFLNPPDFIKPPITFVGEIMLLRPNIEKINPFLLLAFLKHPETIKKIQGIVRGQTAHLYSHDLGKLTVPDKILRDKNIYQEIIDLTEKALHVSNTLNAVSFRRKRLLNSLSL